MDFSVKPFGTLISCILPGFIAIFGIVPLIPVVETWLLPAQQASIGPTVYALMAATAAGLIVGCFRWIIIDHLLEWMRLVPPAPHYENMQERLDAVNHLIHSHYHYYQFYANALVAVVWTYAMYRRTVPFLGLGTDLGMLILCAALFAGARDTLTKYRRRIRQVLGLIAEKGKSHDQRNGPPE